jgi:hypothetical protein
MCLDYNLFCCYDFSPRGKDNEHPHLRDSLSGFVPLQLRCVSQRFLFKPEGGSIMKTISIFVILFIIPSTVAAQVITFETLPDGSPVTDGMFITDQYADSFGVTFALVGSDKPGPWIAKVGPPITAFLGPLREDICYAGGETRDDMPAAGQDVGCYFLTTAPPVIGLPPMLRISYSTPAFQASGYIIDIQAIQLNEEWKVRALRSDGTIIEEITLREGDPITGEGIATPWFFDVLDPIYTIEIEYTGEETPGLAFDNFSTATVIANEKNTWGTIKSLYR